jgi:glycosyltransferase involved in cell wall biosynthesis
MDFIMLANDWSAGHSNPTSKHRIVRELERQGHRVLWVEGTGMRRPNLMGYRARDDRSRIVQKLRKALTPVQQVGERVWLLAPFAVPLPETGLAHWWNNRHCLARTLQAVRRLGFDRPTMISCIPTFDTCLARWPWGRIYHCIDRWDAFPGYPSSVMATTDHHCCRHSDLVLATSRNLVIRCQAQTDVPVRLFSHGVDWAHFRTALAALPPPPDVPDEPVVGYFGYLAEWVDQNLLVAVARRIAPTRLLLIGKASVDVSRLQAEPNILLPGPRPFAELPHYIARFAVGLIPFAVNDLTIAVNPIKLREMLAAGCPVVSTDLPEMRAYMPAVTIAGDQEHFVAAVAERLARPASLAERQQISDLVAGETWAARVHDLVHLAEGIHR